MGLTRSYATGRTATLQASGQIALNDCQQTFIEDNALADYASIGVTVPFNDSGWLGTHSFHPYTTANAVIGGLDFQQITLTCFKGLQASIFSGVVAASPRPLWKTQVFVQGVLIQEWVEAASPDTIVLDVTVSFSADEWAIETDSVSAGSVRAVDAYDPSLAVVWKPTGDITVAVSGSATGSQTVTPASVGMTQINAKADFGFIVNGSWEAQFKRASDPAQPNYSMIQHIAHSPPFTDDVLPEAGTYDSLPFPARYASFSLAQMLGATISDWYHQTWSLSAPSVSEPISHPFSTAQFVAPSTGFGYDSYAGLPSWDVTINGTIRDWVGNLYGVPVDLGNVTRDRIVGTLSGGLLGYGAVVVSDVPVRPSFTATQTVDSQPGNPKPLVRRDLAIGGYTPPNTDAAQLRYGIEWDGLSIARAATLTAEDFAYRWTGSNLSSGPTYAGGELTATGAGAGTPTLAKTLVSDFNDIATDATGPWNWWATFAGGVSAAVSAWWAATGNPANPSGHHNGDWWKIGCRIRAAANSDVFNWSSYRFATLDAYVDTACSVTLTVNWDEIAFVVPDPMSADPYSAALTRTAKSASWMVALGTTAGGTVEIDLASKAGHYGLRYISSLSIMFPNNRTVHLRTITLHGNATATVDVHLPSGDPGFLGTLGDGKNALFLAPRPSSDPSLGFDPISNWGWPCRRLQVAGGSQSYQCHTLDELAAEIGLQEGWTCSVVASPDHSTPNYAVFLEERFAAALPATLKAQRSFGQMTVYPRYSDFADPIVLQANLGNAAEMLVFDPSTHLPVVVTVSAVDPGGAARASGRTDATGAAQLTLRNEQAYTFGAVSDTTLSRIWIPISLTGTPTTGPADLDYCVDPSGEPWLTACMGGAVYQYRGEDMERAHTVTTIINSALLSPSRVIMPDHEHLLAALDAHVAKLWSSPDAATWTLVGTIDNNFTWDGLILRDDPSGALHLWLTRDNGEVWYRVSGDGGATWTSIRTAGGMAACQPERIDARFCSNEWAALLPTAAGGVELWTSADGEAWSRAVIVAGTGTRVWLVPLEPGDLLCFYYDGVSYCARRANWTAASGWTVGACVAVASP